ncbi:MAG: hypothetical protein IJ677_04350 [Alphaproteobacteria bacterium]|nr:hypothetical protein [Alphaproteobacteria bacterium]
MNKDRKHQYHFWRWLILSVVKIPRLYVLVWGFIGLCALAVLKSDIITLIIGLLQ